jgi:hypothetical protein
MLSPSATKKTRQSERSVQRDATRAKKVAVLPDIAGTSLDKGAEIDALAKLPVDKQRSLAEAAKRGRPGPPALPCLKWPLFSNPPTTFGASYWQLAAHATAAV